MKTCHKCHKELPETKFSPGMSKCKECQRALMANVIKRRKELDVAVLDESRRKVFESDKYLSAEAWEKLWPKVQDERFRLYLDLLQSAGLRAHEGLLLTSKDVNFRSEEIAVRTLKRKDHKVRAVPIRADIIAKLVTLTEPYFPWAYETARTRFKTALVKAGIVPSRKEGPALHSLRHLCSTRLRKLGAADAEIGYILGHKAKDVTAIYGQVTSERVREFLTKAWKGQTWLWKSCIKPTLTQEEE